MNTNTVVPPEQRQAPMFIMRRFSGGGVQTQTLSLIVELIRQGHAPSLMVLDGRGPIRAQVPAGCEVVDLKCPGLNRALLPLGRQLRLRRPQIVISTHRPVNWRLVLLRFVLGQPQHLILTERTILHSWRSRHASLRMKLHPLWAHLLYPFASRLVAVSNAVANSLRTTARLRKTVHVIHNGIDLESARLRASEQATHPWLKEPEPKLILGMGRFTGPKNFALLLRAFAYLPDKSCRLMILGEGPDREALQGLAQDLGIAARVQFPGFIDNPFPFLRRCDVFVLPSRWEGFGNVIVEAITCGAPVVATDCPGGPAEILQDHAFGRLVPVDDVQAMAAAIQHMLDAPPDKTRIMEEATNYAIQNTARQYVALMDGLGHATRAQRAVRAGWQP